MPGPPNVGHAPPVGNRPERVPSSRSGTQKPGIVIDLFAWKLRAATLAAGTVLVWGVSLYGLFVDQGLINDLAVVPRRLAGLSGVLSAPLVHGSVAHLAANTLPLLILGGLVMTRGVAYYLKVTLAIVVLGGLGLWVLGRSAAHIGASGLIFGYFGFLVARGFSERRPASIAIALAVGMLYGGLVAGVLPRDDGVSWEAHLCGLLAGAFCARAKFAVRR